MLRIARYLKGFRRQVIIGPIFKLTEAIFELIVPLVMASIIDVGVKNGDTMFILQRGGLMVLLGILGLGCALICQYNAALASQGFGTAVRNDLFRHIESLSHRELDTIGAPSLITRITNDVNQLQVAVAMLIRLVIRAPFLVVGAAVMAMLIDVKLSSIFLIAIPFLVAVLYFVMSRSVPLYKSVQTRLDRISLITRENLVGSRVIRAFSRQEREQARFEETTDQLKDSIIRVGKLSALLNPLTYVIMNAAIIAIIWFGGVQVDQGSLTQGNVIALVNYMTQIILALVVVANLVVIFTKASASARRVNEVFDTRPSIPAVEGEALPLQEDAPAIAFENVSFSYGGGERALAGLSVSIRPGETVGIIGGTGAGKSTLVNLIGRFYDATEGRISLFGSDVKDYPNRQLRELIGIVPQKAVLFSGTLRENMQWRDPDADDSEIARALETAQASEFVEQLPDGYDTRILQGGKNLSGGQKQRLTIARALVGDPRILILDDSASALDFATDAALRRAIARSTKGMTVIMVSQRAHTVRQADRIIVLDEGQVAGIGRHEELLETCQVYREICLSQLSEEEVSRQ
ncbi:MAG: ABC transporter ATP-binding protein [Oscillospiraceae bacterium]|jgi:ATP-binding cassette subfamily B multidrug efflux pump|nr:ABC transporter ATP-binding protein [Oscillospiraceae bacterium]